jgi:purine-binding chemotaxis protein CheW
MSKEAATLADAVSRVDAQLDGAAGTPAAAAPTAGVVDAPRSARFVQFTIDATSYAVSEAFVTELDRVPAITLVPQTPSWLRGVTSLRGDVMSVVDLRVLLGLDPTSAHSGRMLVVRLLDEEFSVGLLVDGVDRIITIEAGAVHPPAAPLEGPLAPFLTGMCVAGEQLVTLFDLERLLRSADIRQFDDVKEEPSCEAR